MDENKNLQAENTDSTKKTEETKKTKKDDGGGIFDWLQCIVSALVLCMLLFTFAGRMVSVFGPSMEDTLIEGDRLIISNLFYTPKQGDIVVLRKESFMSSAIIKRVIATEGQTIDIDFDNGIVYVDGVALEEPYIKELTERQWDFKREVTVPEGCVFVMGDNRNKSTDSRSDSLGFVDTRYILGKALFRVMPFEKFGGLY